MKPMTTAQIIARHDELVPFIRSGAYSDGDAIDKEMQEVLWYAHTLGYDIETHANGPSTLERMSYKDIVEFIQVQIDELKRYRTQHKIAYQLFSELPTLHNFNTINHAWVRQMTTWVNHQVQEGLIGDDEEEKK